MRTEKEEDKIRRLKGMQEGRKRRRKKIGGKWKRKQKEDIRETKNHNKFRNRIRKEKKEIGGYNIKRRMEEKGRLEKRRKK